VVVKSLETHGVQYAFGIPGANIDKVFDTLVNSSIQTVVCGHEQKRGIHRWRHRTLTGKAGVAIATSGQQLCPHRFEPPGRWSCHGQQSSCERT
jgi:acetolactate synthase I/II/III large subunit